MSVRRTKNADLEVVDEVNGVGAQVANVCGKPSPL